MGIGPCLADLSLGVQLPRLLQVTLSEVDEGEDSILVEEFGAHTVDYEANVHVHDGGEHVI